MSMLSPLDNLVRELQSQPARSVYFDLFDGQFSSRQLEMAEHFLSGQLAHAESLESDLPDDMNELAAWMKAGVEAVGRQYHQYLESRKASGERIYFRSKSHALYFLKSVAPTKMVDGAWLYGLLERWQDPRFGALIQTYLEELGEGSPSKNHVVLYKKLLATQGCERWDDLSDESYVQGAIQLTLAYHAERFLPEVIGFNLGYEQLPLHLLISAYELKELGVDPYYFTLHITVDNADSGHAKKAVEAIFAAMPHVGDATEWYRRVQNGYKLNLLGADTPSVIASFDVEREMLAIFARKGSIGQYAHSDYRQVGGRTVNQWLSDASQTADLIQSMENEGWFKRHQDPQNSRFWKMIQSEKAKMFGVFNAYEQQVIYDWIAGNCAGEFTHSPRPQIALEDKQRLRESLETMPEVSAANLHSDTDFDSEAQMVQQLFTSSENQQDAMAMLIALMSPARHHSAPGLMATRIFNEVLS